MKPGDEFRSGGQDDGADCTDGDGDGLQWRCGGWEARGGECKYNSLRDAPTVTRQESDL